MDATEGFKTGGQCCFDGLQGSFALCFTSICSWTLNSVLTFKIRPFLKKICGQSPWNEPLKVNEAAFYSKITMTSSIFLSFFKKTIIFLFLRLILILK